MQKCINKNKRICSVKFGFSQKAALTDLEGRRFPTPALTDSNQILCNDYSEPGEKHRPH
jgi:hypothetical protein